MSHHHQFNSKYLDDIHLVEERRDNETRFPHTDQLQKLLRALTHEFNSGLPQKIATVDHRATDFLKIQRAQAVILFCLYINRARKDRLRLFPIFDENLVSRISIVQRRAANDPEKGTIHRFKFYAGDDFFREVYLNGRRVSFAGHLLDRFSERVPNHIGADLTEFLTMFFGTPVVIMSNNNEGAAVFGYRNSAVFLPVRRTDDDKEYFFPTCLTVNEVNKLEPQLPPPAYVFHFYPEYQTPARRNWNPAATVYQCYHSWKNKVPLSAPKPSIYDGKSWSYLAYSIREILQLGGHGEHSKIRFFDNVHGTSIFQLTQAQPEVSLSEVEMVKPFAPNTSNEELEKAVARVHAAYPQWYSNAPA